MQEIITVLAAILLYGVFHSLLAAFGAKRFFKAFFGARAYYGLYPFLFNTVAVLTFLPVTAIAAVNQGQTLWNISTPLNILFVAIQGVGLGGFALSVLQIDVLRFLGIRQLQAWLNFDPLPLPPETMQRRGVYGLVRHPLYLFSLLFIWFIPVMSAGNFGLNLGITLYFIFGSLLEERKLLHIFGESYATYRREVAWLIPFVWVDRSRQAPAEPLISL